MYWRQKIIICWWDQVVICPHATYVGIEAVLAAAFSRTQSFLDHLGTLNNPYTIYTNRALPIAFQSKIWRYTNVLSICQCLLYVWCFFMVLSITANKINSFHEVMLFLGKQKLSRRICNIAGSDSCYEVPCGVRWWQDRGLEHQSMLLLTEVSEKAILCWRLGGLQSMLVSWLCIPDCPNNVWGCTVVEDTRMSHVNLSMWEKPWITLERRNM